MLRTWRLPVVGGVVLFFALTGPVLALLTPEILRSMQASQPGRHHPGSRPYLARCVRAVDQEPLADRGVRDDHLGCRICRRRSRQRDRATRAHEAGFAKRVRGCERRGVLRTGGRGCSDRSCTDTGDDARGVWCGPVGTAVGSDVGLARVCGTAHRGRRPAFDGRADARRRRYRRRRPLRPFSGGDVGSGCALHTCRAHGCAFAVAGRTGRGSAVAASHDCRRCRLAFWLWQRCSSLGASCSGTCPVS